MYSKIFFNIIFILFLFILQYAFISGLPWWFANINLILIFLIFILGMGKINIAFWWMFGLGLLLEIFSFMPFGIIFISLGLAFILAYILLINFFADKTLYSFLAITLITTMLYEFLLYLLNYLVGFVARSNVNFAVDARFFLQKFEGLILNLLLVVMAYYVINYLSRNLKPVFLIRKK